jgi:hypothetical protein
LNNELFEDWLDHLRSIGIWHDEERQG